MITADHGNDPTTPSTDHSREHVPRAGAGRAGQRPASISARARRSPISDRRSPRTSASARWRTARAFLREIMARRMTRLDPRTARTAGTRNPGAAGLEERRQQGPRARRRPEDPIRPAFQRDRDRIIHTKAFRRLKHKTQVFFSPTGDHYRTRLTHTLEVAQIARTIAKVLHLHEELTEAIALGHDLGHTPFGHAGERVLERACARRLQSLRTEPAHRRRARERPPGPEPDVGSARRHRAPFEGQARHAGRRAARTSREHDRRPGRARRRHRRLRESRHRRCGARRDSAAKRACRRTPSQLLGHSSSERIGRLVTDVVHQTHRRRHDGDPDERAGAARAGRAAQLPVRRGLREPRRDGRVRQGRRASSAACGRRSGSVRRSSSICAPSRPKASMSRRRISSPA